MFHRATRPASSSSFPLEPHLFFPPPALSNLRSGSGSSTPTTSRHHLGLDPDDDHDLSTAGEIQEILQSVSRLASGTGTPVTASAPALGAGAAAKSARGGERGILAEELVSRLASRPQSPLRGLGPAHHRVPVPLKEWTVGQPMELIVLTGQRGGVVPYSRLFDVEEAIGLDLHDLQCHSIASGYLLRFTLLEWDEDRLDRLMVSLKRSLREGAQARVQRTLLHDAYWSWHLQVTIHLSPSAADTPRQVLLVKHRVPAGLIAAL